MKRKLPSLNALKAFEAAGRLGRLHRAADELCVTHSAISRQIQQLEDWLGVALFEGSKHSPRLTPVGNTLLPVLSAAFDQIEAAVSQIADTEEGTLDVSCPSTFTMRWLIPRLQHFNALHPEIEVRLSSRGTSSDPLRDNIEVAIRVGAGPWPEEVDVVPLFDEQFGLVHAPGIRLVAGEPCTVPLLHTVSRRHAWQDWSRISGLPLSGSGATEYEHFYFMREAAIAGLGVAVAPWPLVTEDVASGKLIAPYGFIDSGLRYVALRRRRNNRKADVFCDWLTQAAHDYRSSSEAAQGKS